MCKKIKNTCSLEKILTDIGDAWEDQTAISMPLAALRKEFASEGKDLTAMAVNARHRLN